MKLDINALDTVASVIASRDRERGRVSNQLAQLLVIFLPQGVVSAPREQLAIIASGIASEINERIMIDGSAFTSSFKDYANMRAHIDDDPLVNGRIYMVEDYCCDEVDRPRLKESIRTLANNIADHLMDTSAQVEE